ncbi:MAG TPA: PH domain-containing protein [Nocardioidaceae bacterium]|nr:PH domain-containing protein [Nocardioidaceae bacterium]
MTQAPSRERDYRRLSPLTPLVRSFIFLVAVVGSSWQSALHGELGPIGWLLLALALAGLVYGGASWLRTKYWIEADELRVDTGVIGRQSRRIRIDRLQGIDIGQPFVARLFGLAELRMDVAGSGREGSLSYLKLSEAQQLKELLLARRDAVRAGTAQPEQRVDRHEAPERLLTKVSPGMLAASIALSTETAMSLLGAALLIGLAVWADSLAAVGGLFPVLIGAGLVAFRRFSGAYGFTVTEGPAGLQVRRGLFDLDAQTIALPRLQGITITEPLLWRRLGWARLDVSLAGGGRGDDRHGPASSTVLPVGQRALADWLAAHLLGEPLPAESALSRPPARARWVAPIGRRFMAVGADGAVIVAREGWLARRTHLVPHARVQSLRLSQGPVQRLLRLADLHVDSPPGPVRVRGRHRDEAEARALLESESRTSRAARSCQAGDRS